MIIRRNEEEKDELIEEIREMANNPVASRPAQGKGNGDLMTGWASGRISADTNTLCASEHKIKASITGNQVGKDYINIEYRVLDSSGVTTKLHGDDGYLHKMRITIKNKGNTVYQQDLTGDDSGEYIQGPRFLINKEGKWTLHMKQIATGDCAKNGEELYFSYFTAKKPPQEPQGDEEEPINPDDLTPLLSVGLIGLAGLTVAKLLRGKRKKRAETFESSKKCKNCQTELINGEGVKAICMTGQDKYQPNCSEEDMFCDYTCMQRGCNLCETIHNCNYSFDIGEMNNLCGFCKGCKTTMNAETFDAEGENEYGRNETIKLRYKLVDAIKNMPNEDAWNLIMDLDGEYGTGLTDEEEKEWNDAVKNQNLNEAINLVVIYRNYISGREAEDLIETIKNRNEAETFEAQAPKKFNYKQIIYDTFYGDGDEEIKQYQEEITEQDNPWFPISYYSDKKKFDDKDKTRYFKGMKKFIESHYLYIQENIARFASFTINGKDFLAFRFSEGKEYYITSKEKWLETAKYDLRRSDQPVPYAQIKGMFRLLEKGKYQDFRQALIRNNVRFPNVLNRGVVLNLINVQMREKRNNE